MARKIEWQGKTLHCGHCNHEKFYERKVLLNTRLYSLLNVDWANRNAKCFICEKCGHLEWFFPPKI